MQVSPQEMNASIKRQLERELSYVLSGRDEEEVRRLHAPQTRVQRLQWLFQIFRPDHGQHYFHCDTHRLVAAIVEHGHPMESFIGLHADAESFRHTYLGSESVLVDPAEFVRFP